MKRVQFNDRSALFNTLDDCNQWIDCAIEAGMITSREDAVITDDYIIERREAKDKLNFDLYNYAFPIFGSADPIVMLTVAHAWMMRLNYPENYIDSNLLDADGNVLNTVEKIIDYYNAKRQQLISFDVYRENRIKQYLSEISSF